MINKINTLLAMLLNILSYGTFRQIIIRTRFGVSHYYLRNFKDWHEILDFKLRYFFHNLGNNNLTMRIKCIM